MIEITQKQWDAIPDKQISKWTEEIQKFVPDIPNNFIGKRYAEARYITKNGGSALLTEDIHFKIIENRDCKVEYKLVYNGTTLQKAEMKIIKIYKEYTEETEKLKNIKNTVEGAMEYRNAREKWLEATNEFIGFQKCLAALSIRVIEVEGDK